MKTYNKELAAIITTRVVISGVMANGGSTIITTQIASSLLTAGFASMALPVIRSTDEKTQGIIADALKNRVELVNSTTFERLSTSIGYIIYGRVTESLGVYTLTYYYSALGVETPVTVVGPIGINFGLPYRAHIALLPIDYIHEKPESIIYDGQSPIRINYIYGTAANKFVTSNGSNGIITSFDFKALSIPFVSGAGIVATNVAGALDELKSTPLPAVLTQDTTFGDGFQVKALHGTAVLNPRYTADSNILMSSTVDKTQAWVHLRPAYSEIGFNTMSSLIFDASTAYLSSSKITLGIDSQIITYHTALLWSTMNSSMASSAISAQNVTINAGIYGSVAASGMNYIVKTANSLYSRNLILPHVASGFETLMMSNLLTSDIQIYLPKVTSKISHHVSPTVGIVSYVSTVDGLYVDSIMQHSSVANPTMGIRGVPVVGTTLSIYGYNLAGVIIGNYVEAMGNLAATNKALVLKAANGSVANTALEIQLGDFIQTAGFAAFGTTADNTRRVKIVESSVAQAFETTLSTPAIAEATAGRFVVNGVSTKNVALRLESFGATSNYALLIPTGQVVQGDVVASSVGASHEWKSTTQALLFPRMTTIQRNAIASPVNGMIIYDSTLDTFVGYQAGAWTSISGGGSAVLATPYPHNIVIDTAFYLQTEQVLFKDPASVNTSTFATTALTAPRTVTIPNESGTMVFSSGTVNKIPYYSTTHTLGSSLDWDHVNGRLGINFASSIATLGIVGSVPVGNYDIFDNSSQTVQNASQATSMFYAPNLVWTGGAGTSSVWNVIHSRPTSSILTGNTLTSLYCFKAEAVVNSGTVTNVIGLLIKNTIPSIGATVVNKYAILTEASSGSIGFGTVAPDVSALLDLTSGTQGFLPPRMATGAKTTIATPATGLVVYDTTLNKLCVYTGAAWETVTSA
jgi:hypothetical protein